MSNPTPPGAPVTYEVTAQQETSGQFADGSYGRGTLVTFRLSSGLTGSVLIPMGAFTPDAVAAAIRDAAARMVAVAALRGPV